MQLPINIHDLINGLTVEWERIDGAARRFKEGWNPEDIIHSICAFANDINNLGGGYVIIDIREENGRPLLPPIGIPDTQVDSIQRKLVELCHHRITPHYFPLAVPVIYQEKRLLVLWCFGGDTRPYKAAVTLTDRPQFAYYVRHFASTIRAGANEERQLLELAARIPFDDRINHQASIQDLKLPLIQSFLKDVGSSLLDESASLPFPDLCRQMHIVRGSDEFIKPVNVGLLFFNDNPQSFFPATQIDIVTYHDDIGDNFTEQIFRGPLSDMLRQALQYIRNTVLKEQVRKIGGQAEAKRFFNYPYEAVEEALANAVYHRSYDIREPIEVSIRSDRIEILSFAGPLPPVSNETLRNERVTARSYRNRRIGEFLKELQFTEGRSTGIPKIRRTMQLNGSPAPLFETDVERTYFLTTLPVHAEFQVTIIKQNQPPVNYGVYPSEKGKIVLEFCREPRSRVDILQKIGVSNQTKNYQNYILAFVQAGFLQLTIPNKPTSRHQQYILTSAGEEFLNANQTVTK